MENNKRSLVVTIVVLALLVIGVITAALVSISISVNMETDVEVANTPTVTVISTAAPQEQERLLPRTRAEVIEILKSENPAYYRLVDDGRFTYIFWAGNAEGETLPDGVVIKDNQNDMYFITNYHGVWDMRFDAETDSFFIGARYYTDYQDPEASINETAELLGVTRTELDKHYWNHNNMCGGCATYTVLEKVSLDDYTSTRTGVFGGQEISIDQGVVTVTQYTSDPSTYTCWTNDKPFTEECMGTLAIKVYEIDSTSLAINKEYTTGSIGDIGDGREGYVFIFDLDDVVDLL